jgi:anti-anti-sigma factor
MALTARTSTTEAGPALAVQVHEHPDGTIVVRLSGKLLGRESEWSKPTLETLVAGTEQPIVVDCRELTYADSGGLATLFGWQRRTRRRGRQWWIRGVDGQPLAAIQRSGFIDLLPVAPLGLADS